MMKRFALSCLLLALSATSAFLLAQREAAAGQSSPVVPKASSVVKPQTFVSLAPVPRGKPFEIAVVADIAQGYHVNSRHPTDAYLIATALTPQLPTGIQLVDTIYPDGRNQTFTFSPDKPLNVYSGRVTLKLKLLAQPDAPTGALTIPMTLRYQACHDSTCLPPVKLPVEAKVDIGNANAKSHAAHPEVFAGEPASK